MRPTITPATVRPVRRPAGPGRRPLSPMPKADPWSLPGAPPQGPSVVALGGGHGLAAALVGVRRYAGSIAAVVSVADDGGSSGRLRKDHDVPAPGDLRKCLVALADSDSLWTRAFEHRFEAGDLEGHAFGNLVIAGLADSSGDFEVAPGLPGSHSAALTAQEQELLRFLTDGRTNREIAAALGLSDQAAERALVEMYARLGVSSRSEATALALREEAVP